MAEAWEGWLIDVRLDARTQRMVSWLKLEDGSVRRLSQAWTTCLHVHASREHLGRLAEWLATPELMQAWGITDLTHEAHRLDLDEGQPREVLAVHTNRPGRLRDLADLIDAHGGRWRHTIYSVDPPLSMRYLDEHGCHLFGRIRVEGQGFVALDDRDALEWEPVPLRALRLSVEALDAHGLPSARGRVHSITLDDERPLRPEDLGGDRALIDHLQAELIRRDPDILLTDAGDRIDLPALRRMADRAGVTLHLGRDGEDDRPRGRGRTLFSYGRVLRKEAQNVLRGRLHVGRRDAFMLREGGLEALIELSRLSGISLQDIAHLSPGSVINALQMRQAVEEGCLVAWKRNRPEDLKDGMELIASDRGGHSFDPLVGVHARVIELDFASLFPSIIVTRNISPETLGCACCDPGPAIIEDPIRPGWEHTRLVGDVVEPLPLDLQAATETVTERRLAEDVHAPVHLPYARSMIEGLTPEQRRRHTLPIPGLGRHACGRQLGFMARVIAPLIARRQLCKRRRRTKGDAWDQRQAALKWLLVTCYGYLRYRNARFGRAECHEGITAWGRSILLEALEACEDAGFELLHGIVDSLWVRDRRGRTGVELQEAAEALARSIEATVGVPIDLEACYRWIAFLPNRTNGAGAITKYFGLQTDGSWKVRGIEVRQHSTNDWVGGLQRRTLELLAAAPLDGDGRPRRDVLHAAARLLRDELEALDRGEVPLDDLVETRRVDRELSDYRAATVTAAALERARQLGHVIPAGHTVRFAVLDKQAPHLARRVLLAAEIGAPHEAPRALRIHGTPRGDPEFYRPLALRAVAAVLSPLGWVDADLERAMHPGQRTLLDPTGEHGGWVGAVPAWAAPAIEQVRSRTTSTVTAEPAAKP